MEKGVCHWCTKSGITSCTPLDTNFKDPRMKKCVEMLNARIVANKLLKIAKDIFACKECVSAYHLRTAE